MANAGIMFTTEEAGTIREGHFIAINNRACEVSEVINHPKRRRLEARVSFVAYDIFDRTRHDVPPVASSANYIVPVVKRRDYRVTRMPNGRFVNLDRRIGQDVFEVTDESILTQVRNRLAQPDQGIQLAQGKRLVATVVSSMGVEQISVFKDISPMSFS